MDRKTAAVPERGTTNNCGIDANFVRNGCPEPTARSWPEQRRVCESFTFHRENLR